MSKQLVIQENPEEMSVELLIVTKLIEYVEFVSTKRNKLDNSFFDKLIKNPHICDLTKTDTVLQALMTLIRGLSSPIHFFYEKSINRMQEQYPWMYIYFVIIKLYQNMHFDIFSLGSSLEKPNMVWNTFNASTPDNLITEIPLSGSMYDYGKDNAIVLNEKKRDQMISKYDLLVINNPAFKKLVDTLKENKKDVLITDVKGSGKSLRSLLYLFKAREINVSRLYFLYITTNIDSKDGTISQLVEEDLKQYNYINPILYFNSTNIDPYFIKGEDVGSRCIAHYQREVWDKPPTPVFYDDETNPEMIIENFRRCNFNNFLFIIFTACFFKTFVMPRLENIKTIYTEGQDITNINSEIREFIFSNLSEEKRRKIIEKEQIDLILEQVRRTKLEREDGNKTVQNVDRKYLKYKLKYIKLKEQIDYIKYNKN